MKAHRLNSQLPLFSAAVVLLAGCNATDSLVDSTTAALTTAQCTYEGFDATARACFDTFNSCKSAEGAVLADCKAALDTCLPPPPQGSHPGHREGDGARGDGQCAGGGGGPRPDGGLPPPGGMGGRRGPGGPGGRPPPLAIDSAELTACREAFATCIAADATATDACHATEHGCIRDAFRAQFERKCAEGTAACALEGADAEACARLTDRCAEGIDGRPPNADGGACQ